MQLPYLQAQEKLARLLFFAEAEQAKEALEAGADAVGMEDLAEKIKKGEDDFDVVIANSSNYDDSEPPRKNIRTKRDNAKS